MGRTEQPARILFVFAWLVIGGEETELRLLARHLDPKRYHIEVVACFRKADMPEQTHEQLQALGVGVDRRPYSLSFEETVEYLTRKMVDYDVVVACQAVREVYPALERIELRHRPPLIEHGGLVSEAHAGPKHMTARYVGVCATIRDTAAQAMPSRPHHALEIPSMVDLAEFDPMDRAKVRIEWGVGEETPVAGWVGRLDRKKRVEDFIRAAALVHALEAQMQFFVIGGADAFMPEYEAELRALAADLRLNQVLHFLGDRPDIPRLLSGLDVLVWLSRGEGMPHVIAEAGAARLAVIATRDNGTEEQITDGETGLLVPHEDPQAVADALHALIADSGLRRRLGGSLRRKVERDYSVSAIIPRWERLFEEVMAERGR